MCGAGMFVLMFTLVAGQEELQRLEEEKVEFERREKLHVSDTYFCKPPLLKVSRPRMNEPEQGYAVYVCFASYLSQAYIGHTEGILRAYRGHTEGIPKAYRGHTEGIPTRAYRGHT